MKSICANCRNIVPGEDADGSGFLFRTVKALDQDLHRIKRCLQSFQLSELLQR